MSRDGWVAGELFLEEYARFGMPGPLVAIGTERALRAASEIIGKRGAHVYTVWIAAEGARRPTGELPLEKIAACDDNVTVVFVLHPRGTRQLPARKPLTGGPAELLLV